MVHGNFKYLNRRAFAHKLLHNKAINIAKDIKYDRYQLRLASMVYNFFHKKASDSGIINKNISNKELAEELHKPIIRNFNKRKVHSPFIDNIWGADLDMQLLSKFNKVFRFLLCQMTFVLYMHGLFLSKIKRYYNY